MRWLFLSVCVLVLVGSSGGFAADVEVVGTVSYDTNVYESIGQTQGGMTSRVSMTTSGVLWRNARTALLVEQQAGYKHFWKPVIGESKRGDVFVEQFFVSGIRRIGNSGKWGIRTGAKFKQATRAPGEESYLRLAGESDFTWRLGRYITGRLRGSFGQDDSRDLLLPEVAYKGFGLDWMFSKSRKFVAHLRLSHRWVDYDRLALYVDNAGFILNAKDPQADRATSGHVGFQLYTGMLIQADYGLFRNASNSFGYGYWAHRFQATVVKHLGKGVDAQVFMQFHLRNYDDELPDILGRGAESDEYEQSIGVLKLSRAFAQEKVISIQYGFYRNGARQGVGFYRKHVFSLVVETKM